MARNLLCPPILQLLALRAYASVKDRLGPNAASDPWCGMGLVVARAVADGPDRTPASWQKPWNSGSVYEFWTAYQSALLRTSSMPSRRPPMDRVLKAAHQSRSAPVLFGSWSSKSKSTILFGVRPFEVGPGESFAPLPSSLQSIGVSVDSSLVKASGGTLALLEHLKHEDVDVWVEIPGSEEAWRDWKGDSWRLSHRLGAALWCHEPKAEAWSSYVRFLEEGLSGWLRSSDWGQWVWPSCDLLQRGMENILLYGNPCFQKAAPWGVAGCGRSSDWMKAQKALWSAAEVVLGGATAIDEILVATVLAEKRLLVP